MRKCQQGEDSFGRASWYAQFVNQPLRGRSSNDHLGLDTPATPTFSPSWVRFSFQSFESHPAPFPLMKRNFPFSTLYLCLTALLVGCPIGRIGELLFFYPSPFFWLSLSSSLLSPLCPPETPFSLVLLRFSSPVSLTRLGPHRVDSFVFLVRAASPRCSEFLLVRATRSSFGRAAAPLSLVFPLMSSPHFLKNCDVSADFPAVS